MSASDGLGADVYILGSPIGATLAFMLLQHKAELGVKRVSEIVIFCSEQVVEVELVFTIVDVEEDEEEEKPQEGVEPGVSRFGIGARDLRVKRFMHVKKERVGGSVHEFSVRV